jgi:hypothetical protein
MPLANYDSRVTEATRSDPVIATGFSLCRGGPLYNLGRRVGLLHGPGGLVRPGVALALLTWVPLAVLTFFEGALSSGPRIGFWQSIGTHVRLLVAIPLFFSAEAVFDRRIADVLRRIQQAGLILAREEPRLMAAVRQAIRWRDSWGIEAALVILTAVLIVAGLRADLPLDVATWRTRADGEPTLAGWWYILVCIPVFQFLFWRWCWRLLIWTRFLWRLSRLDLQLIPTHPDAAGGLAGLGVAHVDLAPISLAGSAVLAASYAEQILFAGVPLTAFAISLAAAVIGGTLTLIAPLAFFTPKLIEVKQRALLEYGTLAASYTRAFAAKWLRTDAPPHEPILGTPDLQSLADLGSSFELIRHMTVLPIVPSQVLLLAIAAALPFAPLILLVIPLDQLIIDSVKKLMNI